MARPCYHLFECVTKHSFENYLFYFIHVKESLSFCKNLAVFTMGYHSHFQHLYDALIHCLMHTEKWYDFNLLYEFCFLYCLPQQCRSHLFFKGEIFHVLCRKHAAALSQHPPQFTLPPKSYTLLKKKILDWF